MCWMTWKIWMYPRLTIKLANAPIHIYVSVAACEKNQWTVWNMTPHSIPLSFPIEIAILWSAKPTGGTWTRGIWDVQVLRQGPQGSDVATHPQAYELQWSFTKFGGLLQTGQVNYSKNSKVMKFGLQLCRKYPILLGWGIFELKSAVWTVKKGMQKHVACGIDMMLRRWLAFEHHLANVVQRLKTNTSVQRTRVITIYIYIYQSQNPNVGGS